MRVVLIALLTMTLSGCGLFAKKETEKIYITKTEYIRIDVPKDFRKTCSVTPPLKAEDYMVLTTIEREEYLTDYVINLYGNIEVCNSVRSGVIEIIDKNNELFKDRVDERKSKD